MIQLQRSEQSTQFNSVIALHHAQEVYARKCARATVYALRRRDRREDAKDETILLALARVYKIMADHRDLFVELVQRTVNSDRVDGARRYREVKQLVRISRTKRA